MDRRPPVIEMNMDGSFRRPPAGGLPLSMKVTAAAIVIAGLAGFLVLAALAMWIMSLLIPVAVVAGLVAWGTMRFRRWRLARAWRGGGVTRRS